jgi:hypothetical protein
LSTSATLNRRHSAAQAASTRSLPAESRSPPLPLQKHGPQRDASSPAGRRELEPTSVAAVRAVDTSRSGQTPIIRAQAAPRHRALAASPSLQKPRQQGPGSTVGMDDGCHGTQERAEELASFGYICFGGDGAGSHSFKDRGAEGGGISVSGGRGGVGGDDGGEGRGGEDPGGQRKRLQSLSRILSC